MRGIRMNVIISTVIYAAKFLFKTGIGFVAPWVSPLAKRPMLIIGFGAALIIVPFLINFSGRRAVVENVSQQLTELHQQDTAENMKVAIEQAVIADRLKRAEQKLSESQEKILKDTYDESIKEWASQPLPDAVISVLRSQ